MKWAYLLFIRLYPLLAKLLAPFNSKAALWVKGRKGLIQQIKNSMQLNEQPIIWMHAASLGEFEQGRPVIEAVRKQYPEAKLVLTFFSPSGYEIRKDYDQVDLVCYLPADTPANVNRFLDAVQPDIALFIKYEFWHNYLHELKKNPSSCLGELQSSNY